MGIKYADLEIRWIIVIANKKPQGGDPAFKITSELGYYENGKWVRVGDGPSRMLDLQELYAASSIPVSQAMPNMDPAQDTLGLVLNTLAYGVLTKKLPPPTTLSVVDATTQAPIPGPGNVVIEVPGRSELTIPLPVSGYSIEHPAVQSTIRVTTSDGRSGEWSGPLIGDVVVSISVA